MPQLQNTVLWSWGTQIWLVSTIPKKSLGSGIGRDHRCHSKRTLQWSPKPALRCASVSATDRNEFWSPAWNLFGATVPRRRSCRAKEERARLGALEDDARNPSTAPEAATSVASRAAF